MKRIGIYDDDKAICIEAFCGRANGFPTTFSADYDPRTQMILLTGEWGNNDFSPREVTIQEAVDLTDISFKECLIDALKENNLI